MTTEAEKLAIRQAFAEDLEGTHIMVSGLVSPHKKQLAKEGADTIYYAFAKRGWTIDRGTASAVSTDTLIDEMAGWYVTVQGVAWYYSEELAREGAEAIIARMTAKGWAVV